MNPLYARVASGSVEETSQRLEAAVKAHHFGVLGVIDLAAKMQEKGVAFTRACRIYEVCNPERAKQVLDAHMGISTALPCRITVYEDQGAVTVATLLPTRILELFKTPGLAAVAQDVERDIVAMVDAACQ